MKFRYFLILVLLLVLSMSGQSTAGLVNSSAQIVVSSGAYLMVSEDYTSSGTGAASGSGVIDVKGNLVNNNTSGNPVSTTGTITFSGSEQQQISGNSIQFGSVNLSNSNGLVMACDASVAGTLTLSSGNLDLNGNNIVLGSAATLAETSGRILGSGTISTTRTLSNIDENVAGIGAAITEDGDLGSTTIIRGHTAQGSGGIQRYYQITPTNAPTDAILVFNYLDAELNGATEANLDLYKSADASDWTAQSATLDTDANTLTLSGINSFSYWTAGETGFGSAVRLQAKVFLEGAYDADSDLMTIDLKTAAVIPTTSPYTDDARTVSSIPADITDWVLVQLRSTSDGSAVASKSAFLRKDGLIVADDGTTGYIQLDADAGNYFIVIKQRNHLAVMSDEVHALSASSSTLYDFSVDASTAYDKYYGAEAALLETGVYGMSAGDPNASGGVNATDYLTVKAEIGSSGYYDGDCNLSGSVNATDYLVIKPNVGVNTQVP